MCTVIHSCKSAKCAELQVIWYVHQAALQQMEHPASDSWSLIRSHGPEHQTLLHSAALDMQTSSDMVTALRDGWRPCNARVHGSHTHLHMSIARRSRLCKEPHRCVQVECRGAAVPAGPPFARTASSHSRSLSAQRAGLRRHSSANGSLAASSQPHPHMQQQQHMLQGDCRAGFGAEIARAASAVAAMLRYIQHLRWACIETGHQRRTATTTTHGSSSTCTTEGL